MNKTKAVTKPTPKPETPKGVNTPPLPPTPAKPTRPPAMNLLSEFLKQTNIKLMIDRLDLNVKQVSDGSIIITKPNITAEYIK